MENLRSKLFWLIKYNFLNYSWIKSCQNAGMCSYTTAFFLSVLPFLICEMMTVLMVPNCSLAQLTPTNLESQNLRSSESKISESQNLRILKSQISEPRIFRVFTIFQLSKKWKWFLKKFTIFWWPKSFDNMRFYWIYLVGNSDLIFLDMLVQCSLFLKLNKVNPGLSPAVGIVCQPNYSHIGV